MMYGYPDGPHDYLAGWDGYADTEDSACEPRIGAGFKPGILKVCHYCKKKGLRWRMHEGAWRLWDPDSDGVHTCMEYYREKKWKNE